MKHIKSIYEYRYQLEIPFNPTAHPLHDKPLHVHVQDALKSIKGKESPEHYYSNVNFEDIYVKAEKIALGLYTKGFDDDPDNDSSEFYTLYSDSAYEFLENYSFEEYPEYYREEKMEEIVEYGIELNEVSEIWDYIKDNIEDFLSEIGMKQLREMAEDKFGELSTVFFDEIDSRIIKGTIPIWRAITFGKGDKKDVYERIIEYKGIGEFWAWEEDKAEAHWGEWSDDYQEFIIHGYVKIENVNWENTIIKNVYYLKEEEEIEVIKGADILIYKLTQVQNNVNLKIDPIVVKA